MTFAPLRRLLGAFARLVTPRRCLICRRRLTDGEECICTTCLVRLPYTHFCGAAGNVVERLFWEKLPIVRADAFLYYKHGSPFTRLLFNLKYYGRREVGQYLGRLMAGNLAATDFFDGIDCLVPVPLHRHKERRRGYNQSEMLARGISEVTGIPVVTDAVARTVDTPTQTRLTPEERERNVAEAFSLVRPDALAGRHVLLIDDVITTGATTLSCGTALAKAPGTRISILALSLAGTHHMVADIYEPWQ